MKFQPLLLFILFFNSQFLFSQDMDFSSLIIADSLKQNANSVVRLYDTEIELESSKKMKIKVKKAITILNKLGDNNSQLIFNYDKSNNLKKLKITLFDALGDEVRNVSKKNIKDYHAADGISLFNDGRVKYYKHVPTSYPYTIYYEYEKESSNTAFIPRWFPLNYNQGLEESAFNISFPSDFEIQKLERNFENFTIEKNNNTNNLSFKIRNSPAIKYEELCPSYVTVMPSVMLAITKFHLEGVDGQADSWKDFGKWMFDNLISNRMELPEAAKTKVKNLVTRIDDPVKKAKIIYEYVQNKTRYISVQVGIGGWMPMLASDVDRLSYGDCKALTNYTKSLLDAVGVESYYTAVFAGANKRSMENDVVSVQGNHVFLYIPSEEKDIWLECTSQTVPFGYQGTFTDDRDVLVITPEGGIIKHTGVHKDKNSFQNTLANYKINLEGNLEANVKISTSGIQYRDHYLLENKPERDIHEHYKSSYWSYINNLVVDKYQFSNNKDSIIFMEEIKINAMDYATFSGNRMIFALNAFNRVSHIPKRYRNRKLPLEISRGFIDNDEFIIDLPSEYTIEAIPEAIAIENKFGKYHFSIEKIAPAKLKYSRTFFLEKGTYPAKDYKSYRDFRKQIAKLDKSKIILIKK